MGERVYLNEETNKRASKKINKVGSVLLCIGGIMVLSGIVVIVLALAVWHNPQLIAVGAPLLVLGFAILGIGGQAKFVGNIRHINAYMTQQQLPVVKEAVEEMTPTAKAAMEEMAPSLGVVAKEVAKGVKEGLNDEE